ncbi:M10 family metallopeptidase [Ramlibacter albus]|uniref:M10 family metallopeptidase C-terminal domain-containing protein n=1 Tax=Ramlibacter albus TaxID=2079448 RepID=A0A923S498_9BURK|nr:M10 family metallopeptidase [Ramlibacter albus]MBC5763912.1 M10 family metallopeptidase C-terminal domain-containing protein [Ramlibacter albus]
MENALFTDLVYEPSATPAWTCVCGGCGGSSGLGAGGNTPGDYATTPVDNAYRYVAQAAAQGNGGVAPLMAGSKWTSIDAGTQKTVVTFSFADPRTSVFNYAGGENYAATLKAFSDADKSLVRAILEKIAAVCNVQFVEVADNATQCGVVRYGYSSQPAAMNYAGFAFYPSAAAIGGDVWIDTNQSKAEWDFYRPNLLLHETLHALGLKHPFSGTDRLAADQDIIPNTVMSYSAVAGSSSGSLSQYPAEPMVYDVAALQYLYGASNANSGNTTYDLASAEFQGGFHTVWDAAGIDTLDASRVGRGVTLDLTPGSHSEVGRGVTAQAYKADGTSTTTSYSATLTIAQGAIIENAVGSAYADRITANAASNRIDGGAGTDTVVYTGGRSGYEVVRAGATTTVRDANGTDTLVNVERLQFGDARVALDIDGNAGSAAKLLGAVYGAGALSNASLVGSTLAQLDGGVDRLQVAQRALDAKLGAHASSTAVIDLLFQNLLGRNATAAQHAELDVLVDVFGAAPLTLAAAELPVNQEQVNLVGLSAHGLAYA